MLRADYILFLFKDTICVRADSAKDFIYSVAFYMTLCLASGCIVVEGGILLKQRKLVLCDPEADYAQQMAAFLEKDKDFPWEVAVYTDREGLEHFLERLGAEVLLIAESMAGEILPQRAVGQVVLLNESGVIRFPEIINIDKYQEAENVRRELLKILAQQEEKVYPVLRSVRESGLIGFYSPVRRCLQTGFAIAYSQLLAENRRVLYLNFQHFAGLPWLDTENGEEDLAALLYYLDMEKHKFILRMKSMLRSLGNWDYMAPMRNGTNLPEVREEDWLKLINRCRCSGEYDYIVLDLSDSMQGLLNILGQCNLIYTIVREDAAARYKLERYEHLLERKGCVDIKERTVKLALPIFAGLPTIPENYTKGELAEYARKVMEQNIITREMI